MANTFHPPYKCTDQGLIVPATAEVLASPDQFDPGPHGAFNSATAQRYAGKLVSPIWYVIDQDAGGVVQGQCGGETGTTLVARVGLNPDSGKELYVYGRVKDGEGGEAP